MKNRKNRANHIDGQVYLIGSVADRRVKIGTSRDPRGRLKELQSGNPNPLRILATFQGGRLMEQHLHRVLGRFRVAGEWFDFGEANPIHFVEDAVKHLHDNGDVPTPDELVALRMRAPEPTIKQKVISLLAASDDPMTLAEMSVAIGIVGSLLSVRLSELKKEGYVSNSNRRWTLVKEQEG